MNKAFLKDYIRHLQEINDLMTSTSPAMKTLLKNATKTAEEMQKAETALEKSRLKLFEVAVDPILSKLGEGDWRFVMLLSTDEESAVDSAFRMLGLPNGRADLTWNVRHFNGPFVKGTILSCKTIPAK